MTVWINLDVDETLSSFQKWAFNENGHSWSSDGLQFADKKRWLTKTEKKCHMWRT